MDPRTTRLQVLFDANAIAFTVRRMARDIDAHYRCLGVREVTLVQVLVGATIFAADLLRDLGDLNSMRGSEDRIFWRLDRVDVGSYGAEKVSSGEVREFMLLKSSVE